MILMFLFVMVVYDEKLLRIPNVLRDNRVNNPTERQVFLQLNFP